jgi:hypothetical protein
MSMLDDDAPRPTRPRPLYPALPKLNPATVADVHPDDGPLFLFAIVIVYENAFAVDIVPENPQKSPWLTIIFICFTF